MTNSLNVPGWEHVPGWEVVSSASFFFCETNDGETNDDSVAGHTEHANYHRTRIDAITTPEDAVYLCEAHLAWLRQWTKVDPAHRYACELDWWTKDGNFRGGNEIARRGIGHDYLGNDSIASYMASCFLTPGDALGSMYSTAPRFICDKHLFHPAALGDIDGIVHANIADAARKIMERLR